MDKLIIPQEIVVQIIKHFENLSPEEACGILAGCDGVVSVNYPISNQYHSPVKYFMEPIELYHALQDIDRRNLELLAIYHSHPNGPDHPSETDIKEFLYPGVATIIGFPKMDGSYQVKAFIISNNNFEEINLIVP